MPPEIEAISIKQLMVISSIFNTIHTHHSYVSPRDALCALRGIATVSRPSVRPSVCLSFRPWRWCTLGVCEPQYRQSSPRGTCPKFGWNRGGIALLSRETAISLKRCNCKIGLRLLLMTIHTRFGLVPKSMTLDDLEWQFRTPFQNTCRFGAYHENLNKDRPIISAANI